MMAIALLILYMINQLANGTAIISAIIAFLSAFIVVGVLGNQLKTAYKKPSAANYLREGSFDLYIKEDHFLFSNINKRKIEQKS